jgi:hypothetical protein
MVIRTANYPDRFGPSAKFVGDCSELACLEISGYRIKYRTVFGFYSFKSGVVARFRLQTVTAELQTANVPYFQRKIQLSGFSAYPHGSAPPLIRINGVVLYVRITNVCMCVCVCVCVCACVCVCVCMCVLILNMCLDSTFQYTKHS